MFSKPLLICFDLIQKKFAFSALQKTQISGLYFNSSLDWFSVQESPIVYFDAPIFKGRRKTSYFNDLEMNIRKRIDGWKARFLSFGGKLTLLKSVLSPIPIHTLAVRSPPKTGISKMKSVMANLLWDSNGEHRHHWIAWDSICKSMKEGGLVIRQESFACQTCGGLCCRSVSLGQVYEI